MTLKAMQRYLDDAIRESDALTLQQIGQGLWTKPEIVRYYSRLPIDEPTRYLTGSVLDVLPDTGRSIIIPGGAAGRLGRNIAKEYPNIHVVEIDLSKQMVEAANRIAADEGLDGRFHSEVADAFKIPYDANAFDYAIAHGVTRYYNLEDQVRLVEEMRRVSTLGVSIAEGKARDLIYSLQNAISADTTVLEQELSMFRMSVFFALLRKYENNHDFKLLVDDQGDFIDTLIDLAGISRGTFFELRAR